MAVLLLLAQECDPELLHACLHDEAPIERALARGDALLPAIADLRAKGIRSEKLSRLRIALTPDARLDHAFAIRDYPFDWLGGVMKVKPVLDPGLEIDPPEVSGRTTGEALESLCAATGLDWDLRHGVVFISHADRLWPLPELGKLPPLDRERETKARALIEELGAWSPEKREEALDSLRRIGPRAIPLLREGRRDPDAEIRMRCRLLLDEWLPRVRRHALLPKENAWRWQELRGGDLELAEKLRTARLTVEVRNMEYGELLGRFRWQTGIEVSPCEVRPTVTMFAGTLRAEQALALLTLPYGLDARIEKGRVAVYKR